MPGGYENCWEAESARPASSRPPVSMRLENHVDRLADDHAHARALAKAFASHEGFTLEFGPVETNLVFATINPSLGTAARLPCSSSAGYSSAHRGRK